jgi:hypothetical protein
MELSSNTHPDHVQLPGETAFVYFDMDCDEDIIGYYWPRLGWRAHDLTFLYDASQLGACSCAELCCVSGRHVRLDLTLDHPVTQA